MRNYYFCCSNDMIYTEKEMKKSKLPRSNFSTFYVSARSRIEATNRFMDANPVSIVTKGKRI